jgi:PTS system D-glucosamine-specific IIC component
VDDAILKASGASGVVHKGNGVQIIYGPNVTVVKSDLEDYLAQLTDEIVISSPITGHADNLSTAPDEAFAGRMMGDGAVVTPKEAIIRAPEDGEVTFVFDTGHAVGFMTDTGISLLIHVGIDTVELKGEGFEALVENGQKLKKGEPMLKLELAYLEKNARSLISPVICTELEEGMHIRLLKTGDVKAGEPLFVIENDEKDR